VVFVIVKFTKVTSALFVILKRLSFSNPLKVTLFPIIVTDLFIIILSLVSWIMLKLDKCIVPLFSTNSNAFLIEFMEFVQLILDMMLLSIIMLLFVKFINCKLFNFSKTRVLEYIPNAYTFKILLSCTWYGKVISNV